jgi:thiol-disulfide isomerase/thioredoxin
MAGYVVPSGVATAAEDLVTGDAIALQFVNNLIIVLFKATVYQIWVDCSFIRWYLKRDKPMFRSFFIVVIFRKFNIAMLLNFWLLLLLCIIAACSFAQNDPSPSLNIGDPAPPLRVNGWIKGTPISKFEKGKVYVVEFWATWCSPCIAAMPNLSVLAGEYRDRVTILGIDVYEKKTTSIEKVKAFVDSMGKRMDYHVATDDSNFMVTGWLDASGEKDNGIPKTFVVNAEGKLAWIGHPKDLDEVLPKVVNNTWNIEETLAKRNLLKHLAELDDSLRYELMMYEGDRYKPGDLGKPDSALIVINELIRKEPKLKYAPFIASYTFSSLLKTNPHKAYEYGKMAIVTATYEEPPYSAIIGNIEWYSDKLNLSAEMYELCAEAYQAKIDQIPYPEIVNMPRLYNKMAGWYWRANDKSKAIGAVQKAIETLKSKKDFSVIEMAALESQLRQYRNNKSED